MEVGRKRERSTICAVHECESSISVVHEYVISERKLHEIDCHKTRRHTQPVTSNEAMILGPILMFNLCWKSSLFDTRATVQYRL